MIHNTYDCTIHQELQRKQHDVTRARRASGHPTDAPVYRTMLHMQQRADVMASILKVWCHIRISEIRLRQSMRIYLKNNPAKYHLDLGELEDTVCRRL